MQNDLPKIPECLIVWLVTTLPWVTSHKKMNKVWHDNVKKMLWLVKNSVRKYVHRKWGLPTQKKKSSNTFLQGHHSQMVPMWCPCDNPHDVILILSSYDSITLSHFVTTCDTSQQTRNHILFCVWNTEMHWGMAEVSHVQDLSLHELQFTVKILPITL